MGTFTTINSGVQNNIALAESYLPILDGIYKDASKTAILDTADERIRFTGAATVLVYKTDVQGMADYSRNQGYVTGNQANSWEPHTLQYDRGRSYLVDVMDNDETLGMQLGTLSGEVYRTQLVPEIDATRFAIYAQNAGNTVAADLGDNSNLVSLIDEADVVLGDAEVTPDRVLFVSNRGYKNIKEHIVRMVMNDERGINRTVEYFDDMPVIRVPQSRFYTKIELLDGTTEGEQNGGYVIPQDGTSYAINFMIVARDAVVQIIKHNAPRLFSPQEVQDADAWRYNLRILHGAFVYDNKVNGIYVHHAATAVNP